MVTFEETVAGIETGHSSKFGGKIKLEDFRNLNLNPTRIANRVLHFVTTPALTLWTFDAV